MKLQNKWAKNLIEAGCDEAGRGCLAGPVVAAAVILPDFFRKKDINDSKLMGATQRRDMSDYIKNKALAYAVYEAGVDIIDRHNILQASIHAMHKALESLHIIPEHIIVDGNYFHPYNFIPHQCVIKGDSKFVSIAAASILAKQHRDELMLRLHDEHPEYGWATNMGYATKDHREALRKFGPTKYHRQSFRLDYSG